MIRARCIVAALTLTALAGVAIAGTELGKAADNEPANNSSATATVVSFQGGRVMSFRAKLTQGDVDHWRVTTGNNAQVMVITTPLVGTDANPLTTPDTRVAIVTTTGALVTENDDAGGGTGIQRGSLVRYDADDPTDTFNFRVRGFNASSQGDYVVTLAQPFGLNSDWNESSGTFNDTPATADVVDLGLSGGVVGNCSFNASNDVDVFAVDLTRNDILIVATAPQVSVWTEPDTNLTILASDGTTVLASNDDDNTDGIVPNVVSRGSLVRFKAPQNGRYYVRVNSVGGDTEQYKLVFALVPTAATGCPGDSDGNAIVNFGDITSVLANFGNACP